MTKKSAIAAIFLALTASACLAPSPTNLPPEAHNAALRYWMAFAEMQDPPADNGVSELLEKTAAGEAAWDEAKLGPILDKNDSAIHIMQRATKLPDCDWGLEYTLGPTASIAYAPRARVLARLNTLYGIRLAAKGDHQAAVGSWLAGIRFSQDLAKGGTVIFALIAKTALLSNLHALTLAAEKGGLSAAEKTKVEIVLKALPESGFDWSRALSYEQNAIDIAIKNLKSAPDPEQYYLQLMGQPAPPDLARLSAPDIAAFTVVMSSAIDAMRKKPEDTKHQLPSLQKELDSLNLVYRQMIPSLTKINESRGQIVDARQELLGLVSAK